MPLFGENPGKKTKTKTKTKNDTRELSIPLLSLSGNPFAPPLFCFKVSGEGGIQGKNNLK